MQYALIIKADSEQMAGDYLFNKLPGVDIVHYRQVGTFEAIIVIEFIPEYEGDAAARTIERVLTNWTAEDAGREAPYPFGALLYWCPKATAVTT